MLTIEHCDVEEQIQIGQLFSALQITADVTDENDEVCVPNEFAIQAKSLDTFYPIEAFRITKPEETVVVKLESGETLEASPQHLVLAQDPAEWRLLENLSCGDVVVTTHGRSKIMSIEKSGKEPERLFDLQVSIAHSYYTNDILSHNSHFLTFLGCNALRAGIDVLHYTLELSESAVGIRYDSNLCDVDSNTVIDSKENILQTYKNQKFGRLIIKEFPTNTASIYTIRAHIERLDVRGFRPGLIIIDYADIMRSTRQYDSLRHELKLIYEELRGFASEKKIPIWSASQSNKEGANSDVVDLNNMSEAYGKAMVADVVLSISRKSHEKSTGQGRLYVAKNRAGRDGLVYPALIDTARSKFAITGKAGGIDDFSAQDESEMKKALREKWRELKNEPSLSKQFVSDD